MSEINITEYTSLGKFSNTPLEPSLSSQTVELSIDSSQSKAFNTRTSYLRLVATADCRVAVEKEPQVDALHGTILLAGIPEYFSIIPSNGYKLAAVLL